MDAIALLSKDHRKVETLFRQYKGEHDLVRRRDVAEQIMAELTVHAEMEESHFYPAARRATPGAESLTGESLEEHSKVRRAIGELERLHPEDSAYHPAMERLEELVQHHVQEEESELFPKVSGALGADRLEEIGSRMEEMRRASLPRA
jgi:hemerythrin superfamily protein